MPELMRRATVATGSAIDRRAASGRPLTKARELVANRLYRGPIGDCSFGEKVLSGSRMLGEYPLR